MRPAGGALPKERTLITGDVALDTFMMRFERQAQLGPKNESGPRRNP